MLKILLRIFLGILGFIALPAGAFWLGYREAEKYFYQKLIPLPFEWCGLAAGAGLSFCVLAVSFLILALVSKKRRTTV